MRDDWPGDESECCFPLANFVTRFCSECYPDKSIVSASPLTRAPWVRIFGKPMSPRLLAGRRRGGLMQCDQEGRRMPVQTKRDGEKKFQCR